MHAAVGDPACQKHHETVIVADEAVTDEVGIGIARRPTVLGVHDADLVIDDLESAHDEVTGPEIVGDEHEDELVADPVVAKPLLGHRFTAVTVERRSKDLASSTPVRAEYPSAQPTHLLADHEVLIAETPKGDNLPRVPELRRLRAAARIPASIDRLHDELTAGSHPRNEPTFIPDIGADRRSGSLERCQHRGLVQFARRGPCRRHRGQNRALDDGLARRRVGGFPAFVIGVHRLGVDSVLTHD